MPASALSLGGSAGVGVSQSRVVSEVESAGVEAVRVKAYVVPGVAPRTGEKFKTTTGLNLRSKASTSGQVVAVMKKGATVTATGKRSGAWYELKSGSKTGWASGWYLKPAGVTMPSKKLPVTQAAQKGLAKVSKNGKIPSSQLCSVSYVPKQKAYCGVPLQAWEELNKAFRAKFGTDIAIGYSYRSYADQVKVKEELPLLAAKPGTSNHGWGLAFDLKSTSKVAFRFGSKPYEWLKANAPRYGWGAPSWAWENGSLPEAWHVEYLA